LSAVSSESRLVGALYADAMLLADEARAYFEHEARDGGGEKGGDPLVRVLLSCESLRATTRLMHVIAWLLTRRAVLAGELTPAEALTPSCRLAPPADATAAPTGLPDAAARLMDATAALHARAARLDGALAAGPAGSPVHRLRQRLLNAL